MGFSCVFIGFSWVFIGFSWDSCDSNGISMGFSGDIDQGSLDMHISVKFA